MLGQIESFFDDMECGVHAWELISEIFRDSDKLLTYPLHTILRRAIKIIEKLDLETHKKTIMLSFLNYFIMKDGEPIRDNQNLVCQEVT